jgi:hypothetical protein
MYGCRCAEEVRGNAKGEKGRRETEMQQRLGEKRLRWVSVVEKIKL